VKRKIAASLNNPALFLFNDDKGPFACRIKGHEAAHVDEIVAPRPIKPSAGPQKKSNHQLRRFICFFLSFPSDSYQMMHLHVRSLRSYQMMHQLPPTINVRVGRLVDSYKLMLQY
jgi:hypothetical protein